VKPARASICLLVLFLPAVARAQETSPVQFRWRDHPTLDIGSVRLEVAARAETDARLATPAIGRDRSELAWQSPRVELRGRVVRRLEFEISRDLGDDAAWKDAFVNLRVARTLEIEGGRFKVPFGREMQVSRSNLDFIYRSLGSSQLAPSRDTGAMFHGRLFERRLRYQAGYFGGDGDNARTEQALGGGGTIALRAIVEPLAASNSGKGRLQLGVAMADSRIDSRLGLRGRTLMHDGVFFDRVYVNGRRHRLGLEAYWAAGPASIAGEYMRVTDERNGMGLAGSDLPAVHTSAWYLAGTWALTGEEKDGRLKPDRPVTHRGFGALELVARLEELRFADITHPGTAFSFPNPASLIGNTDRVMTAGANWYLARHLRVQYNHAVEWIADPERSPAPTRNGRFMTAVLRLQLTL
jgi:phosphate-selective porin